MKKQRTFSVKQKSNKVIIIMQKMDERPEGAMSGAEAVKFVYRAYKKGVIKFEGGTSNNSVYSQFNTMHNRVVRDGKYGTIRDTTIMDTFERIVPGWFRFTPAYFIRIEGKTKCNEHQVLEAICKAYEEKEIEFFTKGERTAFRSALTRSRIAVKHKGTGMPTPEKVYQLAQRNLPGAFELIPASFLFIGDVEKLVEVK